MDKPLIGCIFFQICAVPCRFGDLPPHPGSAELLAIIFGIVGLGKETRKGFGIAGIINGGDRSRRGDRPRIWRADPRRTGGAGCDGAQPGGGIAKPRAISVAKRNYPE
ncbi:hypothetical protein [Parasphingopyxis marina]|uniref:Uncharacterized protein n=1 Tax=Parasphingopyxis marina TaxID=2761622 RepID=A0A842HYV5_9SPHN|nr:hypothetical protein [Parasphingopyxis marina]MBC2778346.1 hypothetical protein [Parasphingopyxis marina]